VPEPSHQTDEQLELYALARLPEPEAAILEEHLLVCAACQERLDEVEAFALAMREALATEPATAGRTGWLEWLRPMLSPPWAFAGAAGLTVLVFGALTLFHSGRGVAPIASLQLTAMRGEVQAIGRARETDITLTDSPVKAGLGVEVVDSSGALVWSGVVGLDAGKVKIARQLAQGSYFVRLYDGPGTLLHEYGFRVIAGR
jgi:anti-sigma factor RsiW